MHILEENRYRVITPLHLSVISALVGSLAAKPAKSDPTPSTSAAASQAVDVAGTVANYYGSYQAVVAAFQWSGILGSPAAPVTLGQLQSELTNLGSSLNWKINTLDLARIDGIMSDAKGQSIACYNNNCSIWSTVESINTDSGSALLSFTDPALGMVYFMRTANDAAVAGPWMNAIPDRAPVTTKR